MARKTSEEVRLEIDALKALLPQLRGYARRIEVSIRVLEDGMSSDEVFDRFENCDEWEDAHSALVWRDGHNNTVPSESYTEML